MRTRLASVVFFSAALLSGCGTMGLGDKKADVAEDKVIYHVNNTALQAVDALRNIGNHLEVNPKAKIVVVTHALGVDFLFKEARDKNGNPYNVTVEGLKERGVQFDVCEITLRNRKLGRDKFIPEASFVPSGVAEITRLQQREGYAYLRP
ncbi:MAG TPA: DsrE family protein [Burkholderiales bacterium]|nr:DsrE family protein [Burkholderiales bacterium]